MLANGGVRLDGVWDNGVGGGIIETRLFRERYDGQNIIVLLDDVFVLLVFY